MGEYELGTPLREVIAELGGGLDATPSSRCCPAPPTRSCPPDALDAPLSWEGLAAAGGGLGSAGFIVIDQDVDIVAVAHGVSRFLSVESCGQCTPCKQDGLAITEILDRVRSSAPEADDLEQLPLLAARVTDGRPLLPRPAAPEHRAEPAHAVPRRAGGPRRRPRRGAPGSFPIVPLLDIVDGEAVLALDELDLAPDWGDGTAIDASDRIDVRAR